MTARPSEMTKLEEVFMKPALDQGYRPSIAAQVFATIRGFAAYGFCRAHAAAFALIAYQSAYLKAHYPAEFFAGMLTHMPGFYPAHTLHGRSPALRRGHLAAGHQPQPGHVYR